MADFDYQKMNDNVTADPDSPAGTYRDIIKAMAQQTNRGCAISEYMGCEVQ